MIAARSLALSLLFTIASPAVAQAPKPATTANWILPGCRAFLSSVESKFVGGYCAGTVATLMDISAGLPPNTRFCPPPDASFKEAVWVVVSHIDRHPQRLGEEFSALALEALRQAWPCRK